MGLINTTNYKELTVGELKATIAECKEELERREKAEQQRLKDNLISAIKAITDDGYELSLHVEGETPLEIFDETDVIIKFI